MRFTCTKCDLHKTCISPIWSDGDNFDIMFVGEAPGKNEDEQGKPFVGYSGKILRSVLDKPYYITNIVKCRPPDNRTPTDSEINTCLPYLIHQIDTIKPKVLVLLGNSSQKLLKFYNPTVDVIKHPHPMAGVYSGKVEEWKESLKTKLNKFNL